MYSPVANIHILLALKEEKLLPNYLLLLAHEVVQYPEEFRHLTHKFNGTLILDNSLIELGKPADPSVILKAAEVTNPDFVVLPDKLSDAERTLAEVEKALTTWASDLPKKSSYMVVAQGKDQIEVAQCAKDLVSLATDSLKTKGAKYTIPMIGVPRILTNTKMKRSTIVPLMNIHRAPIHLLGMSEDFKDDMRCFVNRAVTGIDSATPIRCGYEDILYTLQGHDMLPKLARERFFHECKELNGPIVYNIAFISGIVASLKNGI